MIALLTPTGARPQQIKLCAEFMRRQDYEGDVLWVLVDDAVPVTINYIRDHFRLNWQIVRIFPEAKWRPGMNTQARNLLAGLTEIKKHKVDGVFIIEDDDYYRPEYLRLMAEQLKGYKVTGQTRTIYYNPILYAYSRNPNIKHASLFQIAFSPVVLSVFEQVCKAAPRFIDIHFFKALRGNGVNLFEGVPLPVGMKGLPGRAGIGIGHKMGARMTPDPNKVKLKELLKEDYVYYL